MINFHSGDINVGRKCAGIDWWSNASGGGTGLVCAVETLDCLVNRNFEKARSPAFGFLVGAGVATAGFFMFGNGLVREERLTQKTVPPEVTTLLKQRTPSPEQLATVNKLLDDFCNRHFKPCPPEAAKLSDLPVKQVWQNVQASSSTDGVKKDFYKTLRSIKAILERAPIEYKQVTQNVTLHEVVGLRRVDAMVAVPAAG